jgi:hypothetical protein
MNNATLVVLLSESILKNKPLTIDENVLADLVRKGIDMIRGKTRGYIPKNPVSEWNQVKKVVPSQTLQQIRYGKDPIFLALQFAKMAGPKGLYKDKVLAAINASTAPLLAAVQAQKKVLYNNKIGEGVSMTPEVTEIIENELKTTKAYKALETYIRAIQKSVNSTSAESVDRIADAITEDIHINNGRIFE